MNLIGLFVAVPIVLIIGGLLLNRPPLLAPPGLVERLKVYLTTNVAETGLDHQFPELRPPLVAADPGRTQDVVLRAISSLGWRDVQVAEGEIRAVVGSPILGFKDDVTVRLERAGDGTLVLVRSASRVGKGDLAANSRHIQMLFSEISALTSSP